MQKTIVIGTNNDIKVACVTDVVAMVFPQECYFFVKYNASSGISEQPLGLDQILVGARNRIQDCKNKFTDAAYIVAIESGIVYLSLVKKYFDTSVTLILDQNGQEAMGWSTGFEVIPEVMKLVSEGKTLGKATDLIYGTTDIGNKEGYSGILTENLIPRKALHLYPTIFAFKTLQALTTP